MRTTVSTLTAPEELVEFESAPDSPYVGGLIRDDDELLIWIGPAAVNEAVL